MPTSIAFTICSINYLAQAITLGDSLRNSNTEVEFRIYLVDKLTESGIRRESIPFPVIEIENIPVVDFTGMCVRYSITELNTSVKPFIFDHIFSNESDVKNVIYFDPDIMVLGSLDELLNKLESNTIVLTPHILQPCEEHPRGQSEKNYLVAGTFNLGFIGVSRQDETFEFLKWWQRRLVHQGYGNNSMHLFYDQKWLNLAIVFFQKVLIEKSPGYNMAGWNLHEREITGQINNKYIINKEYELVFYHFSGVKVEGEDVSFYTKYTFHERPDLVDIIGDYRKNLTKNGYLYFSKFKCYYSQFYRGITIYYPRYHWITIYRRTRFNLGKLKRIVSDSLKAII